MQEKIFLKEFKTGTTAWFFDTNINESSKQSFFPAYVLYNDQNIPIDISTFDQDILWRNPLTNVHEPIENSGFNYVTGGVITQTYNYVLNDREKSKTFFKMGRR